MKCILFLEHGHISESFESHCQFGPHTCGIRLLMGTASQRALLDKTKINAICFLNTDIDLNILIKTIIIEKYNAFLRCVLNLA